MNQIYANAPEMQMPQGAALNVEELVEIVSRLAPTASVMMLVLATGINLYLAGKITQKSGRLARPWPDLHQLTMPPIGAYGFLGSLLVMFAPGLLGIFAQIVASSLGTILMLIGLSVLHFLTRSNSARLFLLIMTYFLLVVFVWIGLLFTMLGAAEVLLNIRSRATKGPQLPRKPDGGADGGSNP